MMQDFFRVLYRTAFAGLATLPLLGSMTPAAAAEPASTRWHTEKAPVTAMAIAVPPGAFVEHGGLVSRHRGYDIIQVSSFELGQGHHAIRGVPEGEWIVHYAYEANSFDPTGELRDFVDAKLASLDYLPTGDEPVVGGKRFIELDGELGTMWITHRGWNVYSFMIYGGIERAPLQLIEAMVMGWQLEQDEPIHIAPEDHGYWSGGLPSEEPTLALRLPGQPSMEMPWSSTATYTYLAGPHHPQHTGNGCGNTYNTSDMSGIDFGLPNNTEVLAVASGKVQSAGNIGDGRGNFVRIEHTGYGIASEYWHLSSTSVTAGNNVSQGKVVGKSGNSSNVGGLGYHLHFELRYYPSLSRYPMHGLQIDGYTVLALQRYSPSNQSFNYQGTLTKGGSYGHNIWYCDQWATKWYGYSQTITAGSSTKASSTNVRIP